MSKGIGCWIGLIWSNSHACWRHVFFWLRLPERVSSKQVMTDAVRRRNISFTRHAFFSESTLARRMFIFAVWVFARPFFGRRNHVRQNMERLAVFPPKKGGQTQNAKIHRLRVSIRKRKMGNARVKLILLFLNASVINWDISTGQAATSTKKLAGQQACWIRPYQPNSSNQCLLTWHHVFLYRICWA